MILTCPECATSYFVDDSKVAAAGRTVKCSNCGARWTALPGGQEASAPAAPPPKPAPAATATPAPIVDELVIDGPPTAEDLAKLQPKPKRSTAPGREANGKVTIWVASAVIAAALIAGVIVFRAQVVRLLPASQAAYAGLGLPVSSLLIEKVRAEPAFQGGRAVLSVSGQIRNLRDAPAVAPAVRVTLLDRFGKPMAVKVARPIDAAVPAHAVRYFAISLVDPPAGAHDLQVAFDPVVKGAPPPVSAPVPTPAPAEAAPQPTEAKPLPPGSPDALPPR